MTLVWLLVIPLVGGVIAGFLGRFGRKAPGLVSFGALALDLLLAGLFWVRHFLGMAPGGRWLAEAKAPWIPELGISLHFGLDGLSLLLVLLTGFLGLMAASAAWREIRERPGFFHFNLLWCLTGILGVFTSLDLFMFYFFWELMLVPMYFLISIWGHENRRYAAFKFFLFTQLSGLLMLAAILGLYFLHGQDTGVYTFDAPALMGTRLSTMASMLLMAGFLAAFLTKLPAFLLHTWLPDAHTEAPTAGSVVLAGLLLKTGAYGLLRFAVPLFPQAAAIYAPWAMGLGVAGILYGAVLAFAQTDLKRLVAYTSVSHMGFILLGVFAWNDLALQGVVVQMMCHGISTGALFYLVGGLQERLGTRDLRRMGGLWSVVPGLSGVGLFFALASLGLPGLGNFVAEFLVLLGAYQAHAILASIAAVGFVTAAAYALWMAQRAFFGEAEEKSGLADLSSMETAVSAAMIAAIVWIGVYPQPFITTARQGLDNIRQVERAPAQANGAIPAHTGEKPL